MNSPSTPLLNLKPTSSSTTTRILRSPDSVLSPTIPPLAGQTTLAAIGLENSGVRFLWVVRAPSPENESENTKTAAEPSLDSFLPEGFLERTKDRGYVVRGWAPQVAVLNHDSVGGFVTHCGWNSVLESIRAGVPMLAWALYAEQNIHELTLVDELGVALRLNKMEDGMVSAGELEKRLIELMDPDSDERKALEERVMALKEKVLGAMSPDGPSRAALAKFTASIK